MSARYNGYTSCPLVTRVGTAMLVEFDYDDNLTPSFPFIDPLTESWISWVIEEKALKPTYHAHAARATREPGGTTMQDFHPATLFVIAQETLGFLSLARQSGSL